MANDTFQLDLRSINRVEKSEMSNWSKNIGNSHSHLNLKRNGIRNSHSGVNFQNSIPIPIHESIQFSIQFLVLYVK